VTRRRGGRGRARWLRHGLAPLALLLSLAACGSEPPPPAPLDTKNEQCGFCRMAVSDARFAGQLVAPGEIPLFFDDLGCLGAYLKGGGSVPRGALAYVADHRTKAWLRADVAVYTRVPGLATPMGSHLLAHADAASRDADPDARGGSPATLEDVFGPKGPPGPAR
jgi:copper chaperone NosL